MNKKILFIYFIKSFLIISGLKGRIVKNLSKCCVFLSCNQLFFVNFSRNFCREKTNFILTQSFRGVHFNFSKKLNLVGIGFRCWIIFENNSKYLIVKTSLSKDCVFYVPKTIDVFCLNSTTIFIVGPTKLAIERFIFLIKNIKKTNFYKQKGVFFENEFVKTKLGKKM